MSAQLQASAQPSQTTRRPLFSIVSSSPALFSKASSPSDIPPADETAPDTVPAGLILIKELRAIVQLLEADKECGKPSGYVKQARKHLKRLLGELPDLLGELPA